MNKNYCLNNEKLDKEKNKMIIKNAIDFFIEKRNNKKNQNNHKIKGSEIEIIKNKQPTIYNNNKYNKRKISELPFLISKLIDLDYRECLSLFNDYIYFNFDFLNGLIRNEFDFINNDIIINLYKLRTIFYKELYNLYEIIIITKLLFKYKKLIKYNLDSAFNYILSDLLFFYKHNKYITNLIDECDEKSYKQCALVTPYDMYKISNYPVLLNYKKPITNICEYIINEVYYYFMISDKLQLFYMINEMEIENCGEIKLHPKSYSLLLVYLDENINNKKDILIENLKGGFICATNDTNELISFNFNGQILFNKILDNKIEEIYMIYKDKVLVHYKENILIDFIDIFDINTGILFKREHLGKNKKTIKKLVCNSNSKYVNLTECFSDKNQNIFIYVGFNNNELIIYKINLFLFDNETNHKLFNILYKMPSSINTFSNIGLLSLGFKNNYYKLKNNFLYISYDDGSILILPLIKNNIKKFSLIKFKNEINYEILDFLYELINYTIVLFLLIGSDKNVYLTKFSKVYCIKGDFETGRLYDNGKKIYLLNKDTIFIYELINYSNEN